MRMEDLQQIDVGMEGADWAGQRIPSLEDVLATIPDKKRVFVERINAGRRLSTSLNALSKRPASRRTRLP